MLPFLSIVGLKVGFKFLIKMPYALNRRVSKSTFFYIILHFATMLIMPKN